jgi:hypothetical protein
VQSVPASFSFNEFAALHLSSIGWFCVRLRKSCHTFWDTTRSTSRCASLSVDSIAGASLGGTVSHYRRKQNVYTQGTAVDSLFYIQEGEVRPLERCPARITNRFRVAQCGGGYILALRQQLSRDGTIKQDANVYLCEQTSIIVSFMMLPQEEVRRVNQIPPRSEVETWKPF